MKKDQIKKSTEMSYGIDYLYQLNIILIFFAEDPFNMGIQVFEIEEAHIRYVESNGCFR